MGLEVANYLDELVVTNPVGATDPKSQGDDHLRLLKSALKSTFPGLAGSAFRIQTKTTDFALAVTDNMSVLLCTAALELTLPDAGTIGNKQMTIVICNGPSVTFNPTGADTINGLSSLALSFSQVAIIFCDGDSDYPVVMVGGTSSGFVTGDVKASMRANPEPGWITAFGTIGDALSAASNRANDDCEALFLQAWTDWANAQAPVSGGRGASAAADWAAHKTIGVADIRDRAVAGKGGSLLTNGGGLNGAILGNTGGLEKQTNQDGPNLTTLVEGNAVGNPVLVASQSHTHANQRVVQPTIILNYFIKL